jgi:hypothetical protein
VCIFFGWFILNITYEKQIVCVCVVISEVFEGINLSWHLHKNRKTLTRRIEADETPRETLVSAVERSGQPSEASAASLFVLDGQEELELRRQLVF